MDDIIRSAELTLRCRDCRYSRRRFVRTNLIVMKMNTWALMARATLSIVLAGLSGCATPYGRSGLTGGYVDSRLNEHLITVQFYGNISVTTELVQSYAMYRCAEIAAKAGKPYFVIYSDLNAAALDLPSALPQVGSLADKPIAVAFLSLEDHRRNGAHQTQAVIERLRAVVQASQTPEGLAR